MSVLLSIAAALAAAAPAAPAVKVPEGAALVEQIRAADADLFGLFFSTNCDTARFRAMLADDLEFYHDKGGFNVRSGDEFASMFARQCAERQAPTAWRSRRELVPSSLHVDPVPGHGAIQAGEHLFYEKEGVNGVEKLAGRARFAQLWVLGADGEWRVSRVFSFGHRPAE